MRHFDIKIINSVHRAINIEDFSPEIWKTELFKMDEI